MTCEKILAPGEGPKQIVKVIDRIGVTGDGETCRIKFVDSDQIFSIDLTLKFWDDKHSSEDDVILAKPGDLIQATVDMRFGRLIAHNITNLSLSGVRGSAD
jgi:hypothetical protein